MRRRCLPKYSTRSGPGWVRRFPWVSGSGGFGIVASGFGTSYDVHKALLYHSTCTCTLCIYNASRIHAKHTQRRRRSPPVPPWSSLKGPPPLPLPPRLCRLASEDSPPKTRAFLSSSSSTTYHGVERRAVINHGQIGHGRTSRVCVAPARGARKKGGKGASEGSGRGMVN